MEVAEQLAAAPGGRHDVADARQRLRPASVTGDLIVQHTP